MSLPRLNEESFSALAQNDERPLVVDFYADWCGPCHQLAPIIDSLAKKYVGRVDFAKVNVDDEPELAAKYQIRSIPAVILFRGGQPRARSIGAKPPQLLAMDLELDRYAGNGSAEDNGEREEEKVGAVRKWWGRR